MPTGSFESTILSLLNFIRKQIINYYDVIVIRRLRRYRSRRDRKENLRKRHHGFLQLKVSSDKILHRQLHRYHSPRLPVPSRLQKPLLHLLGFFFLVSKRQTIPQPSRDYFARECIQTIIGSDISQNIHSNSVAVIRIGIPFED